MALFYASFLAKIDKHVRNVLIGNRLKTTLASVLEELESRFMREEFVCLSSVTETLA